MKANLRVFHVLDLDRTLLDTAKLVDCLVKIIKRHNRQLAELVTLQIAMHAQQDTSFFIFEYIVQKVGKQKLQEYIHELHTLYSSDTFLMPGARERVVFCKSQPGWGMGILTYGSKQDQRIKLQIVGMETELYILTDTPYKGKILASWKTREGKYRLPQEFGGHIADVLTLDDDKLRAFENLPQDIFGQWITNNSTPQVVVTQNLPSNIKPVSNLEESIDYLITKLANL